MRFDEKRSIKKRAIAGTLIMAAFILLLIGRMAYLQIWDHQKYTTLSKRNQLRIIPIPAARGLIYDRHGAILAKNVPAFHLTLVPEKIENLPHTLESLSKIVALSPTQRQTFLEHIAQRPSHQRQILPVLLSEEEVSRFAVNQYRFPGVTLMVDMMREYPHGPLLAHVLGYVSEMNKEEMQKVDQKRYAGNLQLGKNGLEKTYEAHLQGESGYHQLETDVMGREIRTLYTHPCVAGKDLHLTIDLPLQQAALAALGEERGAIVVMNPLNGDILAMVSAPSFDPNLFVKGLDNATYQQLRQAPDRPLFNRAIQGQYPPASTIKPVVALAGLMQDKITPQDRIFDPGWYQLNGAGRHYRDWAKKGHGVTDLEKALRESCDTYFYIAAEKLGIAHMAYWFQQVGLGKPTGIDIPGEGKGIVPTSAWKRKALGAPWYPGETLITGIGQGYTLATPVQLAVMACYLANRGEAFKPHFYQKAVPEKLPSMSVPNAQFWKDIIEPMRQVTQHPRGTAYRHFANLGIDVAGKTGTAQVFGLKANEKYHHDQLSKHLRDHTLFIGFAPAEKPEIAIAVILENQRASALVSRRVIEAYFKPEQSIKVSQDESLPITESEG